MAGAASENYEAVIRGALCAALVLGPALWLRGDPVGHFILAFLVGITLWPFSGAMWALGRWLGGRPEQARTRNVDLAMAAFFKPIFVAATCLVGSWFVGALIRSYDLHAAQRWCEARIDDVERFHAAHGRYPAELSEVADVSSGPLLVRDGSTELYAWDGGYSFDILFDMLQSANWDSERRYWDH